MTDLRPMHERMVFGPKELQPNGTYKKPTKRLSGKQVKKLKNLISMKKCRYCHSTENLTLDHKIPLIKGGKNEKKNLQCLCGRCNGMKSDLTSMEVKRLFEWFTWITISKVENIKIAKRKKKDDLSN